MSRRTRKKLASLNKHAEHGEAWIPRFQAINLAFKLLLASVKHRYIHVRLFDE